MPSPKTEILINSEMPLRDVQTAFNQTYPYLNIEFSVGKRNTQTNKQKTLITNYQVKDFSLVSNPVVISIAPHRTIKEIVYDFRNLAGLQIEVFRKSGNVWNSISVTDSWTLQSQNLAGRSICEEIDSYE